MKKLATLTLAAALTCSLPAAVSAEDLLIMGKPEAPSNDTLLIMDKPSTVIVNGVTLDNSHLPPEAGIPLRAFCEADGGSAEWYPEENLSLFYTQDGTIQVSFATGEATVGDQVFSGARAVEGVTFVPAAVVDALDNVTVTEDLGTYTITTSSSDPLVKLAKEIQSATQMGQGMKTPAAQMEEYYGIRTENFESVVGYFPMMVNADSLIIGKVVPGKLEDAKADLEARKAAVIQSFENYLPDPLDMAKNGRIVSNGDYVMLVISPDNDTAVQIFNDTVKGL